MKILILTALLAVVSCCRVESRDLHVDPGIGDDGNDGITSSLKTIRQAIVASYSDVAASHPISLNCASLDMISYDVCPINGRPNPADANSPGTKLDQLIKIVVPKSFQSHFRNR